MSEHPNSYRHRLPAAIERLDSLPALAESRNRLLRVLLADDPKPRDLVALIESDVALTVAVMRMANQKEGRGGKVGSVPDALRIVSPEGVETIARRIGVYGFFEQLGGWELPPERFRLHAVTVAGSAEFLARELDLPKPGELFVAALLHDIGKIVLAEAHPGYGERMTSRDVSPAERVRQERREFGIDHSVIGGVLLRRWRFPNGVARAVERHHADDATGEAAVLRLADALAHYEQGATVTPQELEVAGRALDLTSSDLEAIMFRLPEKGSGAPRATEPSPLSPQEREVLRGLAASKVYKEISLDLGIAASTVRSHTHNVYVKLGAVDRAQAVLLATRQGWL